MGCEDRIDSSDIDPSLITKGIFQFILGLIMQLRCLNSKMILKFVVCLLGPSIIGSGCEKILVGDQRLF